MSDKIRLYFVTGEVSGDTLGAELLDAFETLDIPVEAMGLGGDKMKKRGMQTLFDTSEIAIMGVSGVLMKLPKLFGRIRQVADDIVEKKPDAVILIDSPEFAKQVAMRVKRKLPDMKIIKYVCPQVWAWRQRRAKKMKRYIDHVLAILPFEPELMQKFGGPETSYVGHPLARLAGKTKSGPKRKPKKRPRILLMPGSRRGELAKMLPVFKETVSILHERGLKADYVLPAVPHLVAELRAETAKWLQEVEIVEGDDAKQEAFKKADAAIATSGTAILELAMYMVPCISVYKVEAAVKAVSFIIKAWTAALPNLIADRIVVPEKMNEFAHPQYIARVVESLVVEGPERDAQLNGFEIVHQRMKQKDDPAVVAAKVISDLLV